MTSLLARLIADLNGTLHFAQILFYTLSAMLLWLYLRPQNFVKHIFLRDLLVELFLTKQRHSGNTMCSKIDYNSNKNPGPIFSKEKRVVREG